MRILTDEQHASLIYALELIYEGKAQLETVPEALATLAAAPSLEVVGKVTESTSTAFEVEFKNLIDVETPLYAIKETP